ncbi:MAG: hypothetical protein IKI20_01620 [Lachnospiraceae bacterium]|nr:hypothetical protein [Lachnospiraceae bacterium]
MPYTEEQKRDFDKKAGFEKRKFEDIYFDIAKRVNRLPELPGVDPHDQLAKRPLPKEISDKYGRAGFVSDRTTSHTSIFYFYLMGVKKIPFKDLVKITPESPEFEGYLADYDKFLSENPVKAFGEFPEPDPVTRKKSIGNWMNLFADCGEMMKDYKFPDIDYSNPEEVKKYEDELILLSKVVMDYSQELDRFVEDNSYDKISTVKGGTMAYWTKRSYGDCLQSTMGFLNEGFFRSPMQAGPNRSSKVDIMNSAVQRHSFVKESAFFKGKTVEQYLHAKEVNVTLGSYNQMLKAKMIEKIPELSEKDAVDYLTGSNKNIEPKLEEISNDVKNKQRINFNVVTLDRYNRSFPTFLKDLKERDNFINALNNAKGKDNIDLYMHVKSDAGSALRNLTERSFTKLYQGGGATAMSFLKKDALDLIRIGGMTAEQRWGRKYAFLDNPEEKKMMYRIEIMREMYEGKTDITMDLYFFNEEGKLYNSGVCYIAMKPATVIRLANLKAYVDGLRKQYRQTYRELQNAENGLSEEEKQLLNNDQKYAAFKGKLAEVIHKSNTQDFDGNLGLLLNAMDEYKAAAKDYVATHETQHSPNANIRALEEQWVKTAKVAALGVDKYSHEIKIQAANFGLIPGQDEELTAPKYSYHRLEKIITEQNNLRPNTELLEQHKEMPKDSMLPDDEIAWAFPPEGEKHPDFNKELKEEKLLQLDQHGGGFLNDIRIENNYAKFGTRDFKPGDKRIERIGLSGDRPPTTQSIFLLWVLGTQEDFKVENIKELFESPRIGADGTVLNQDLIDKRKDLMKKFFEFYEKNPTEDNKSDKQFKESIENWMTVFNKATEKMGQYKLPVIDYTDKDQVAPYIEDFSLIAKLSVDCCQELPHIIGGQSGKTITGKQAAGTTGGVNNYDKLLAKWEGYQCVIDPVYHGYASVFVLPYNTLSEYAVNACRQATARAFCKTQVNPYAGKTMSETVAELNTSVLYRIEVDNAISTDSGSELQKNGCSGYQESLGYYLGKGNTSFESKVQKAYEKKFEEKAASYSKSILGACNKFTASAARFGKDLFKNVGDKAEDMQNFLNGTALAYGNQPKAAKLIVQDAMENLLLNNYYRRVTMELGLRHSQCFRINGKSAEELWGEKYANVQDADEKEFLYQAEIVRLAAEGGSKIELLHLEVHHIPGKYSIVPGGYDVAMETPEKMREIVQSSRIYDVALEEYLNELKEIQKTLLRTQDNKSANRSGKDSPREGSDYYQNMMVSLDKLIVNLQTEVESGFDGPETDKLDRMINEMQNNADTYYENRKGVIFGPIHDYGQVRLKNSKKLDELTAGFKERFRVLRNGFSSGLTASDGIKLNNTSSKYRRLFVDEIGDYMKIPNNKKDVYEKKYAELVAFHNLEKINTMQIPTKPYPRKNYEMAKKYLKHLVTNAQGYKDLSVSDSRKFEHSADELEKLAGNPVFQKLMRDNPDFTVKNWREIEQKAEKKVDQFDKEIDLVIDKNSCYSRCLVGFGKNGFLTLKGKAKPELDAIYTEVEDYKKEHPNADMKDPDLKEIILACRKQKEDQNYSDCGIKIMRMDAKGLKQTYNKLTTIILTQMLYADNEVSDLIRQSMSADELLNNQDPQHDKQTTYKEVAKSVLKKLLNGKALEGDNIENTLRDLDNGKLAGHMTKEFAQEFVEKREQIKVADKLAEEAGNAHHNQAPGVMNPN